MLKEIFKWTGECEKAFSKLKKFLALLPILTRPITSSPLYLYLYITNHALSLIVIQKTDRVEQYVYFVSKVFRGSEDHYQNIEKIVLVVVVTSRNLISYFQLHLILVKIYYPTPHILKNPNLAEIMVSWEVEVHG